MIWKIFFLRDRIGEQAYKASVAEDTGTKIFPPVDIRNPGELCEFVETMRAYEAVITVDPPKESTPPITIDLPASMPHMEVFLTDPYVVIPRVSASGEEIEQRLRAWSTRQTLH